MFSWLRTLLGGVARGLRWCVVTGVSTVEALGGGLLVGMWRGLFAPPPPVLEEREAGELEKVVDLLTARSIGADAAAEREAVQDHSVRPRAIDPAAATASRELALRYTTAVIHGTERPSLVGVEPAMMHRLRKLKSPAQAAPLHRDLMSVLGVECQEGWWDGPRHRREVLAPDRDDPAVALSI